MAIFIDTGIFVAVRNKRDNNHARGKLLMKQALTGQYGQILTSDYVVDEAVTTALARTRRLDIAKKTGRYIMDSPRILKLHISEEEFNKAWKKFQELRKPLSFTDTTTLTLMEEHGVEKIMSFDSDFDGLTQRIS